MFLVHLNQSEEALQNILTKIPRNVLMTSVLFTWKWITIVFENLTIMLQWQGQMTMVRKVGVMDAFSSPRPTPRFFTEPQTFSTKKVMSLFYNFLFLKLCSRFFNHVSCFRLILHLVYMIFRVAWFSWAGIVKWWMCEHSTNISLNHFSVPLFPHAPT